MSPLAVILIIAGIAALVAYLATRRRGPRITTITRDTQSKDPE